MIGGREQGPIRHLTVPGDIGDGSERLYREEHLTITRPTLPFTMTLAQGTRFLNALPATFVPLLVRGQNEHPDAGRSPYRGVTVFDLAPVIEKRHPWE